MRSLLGHVYVSRHVFTMSLFLCIDGVEARPYTVEKLDSSAFQRCMGELQRFRCRRSTRRRMNATNTHVYLSRHGRRVRPARAIVIFGARRCTVGKPCSSPFHTTIVRLQPQRCRRTRTQNMPKNATIVRVRRIGLPPRSMVEHLETVESTKMSLVERGR